MLNTKNNIFKNGIASFFQKSVRVLEQLLLVPFFISAWGAAYYGEWLTLTIIPSILAYSDLGFGTAAANSFVLKYASGDKQSAADISKTGFIIISFAILIGILIGGIILAIIIHFNLLESSLIPFKEAVLAIFFIMFAKVMSFYNQLSEAHYRAARKASLSINYITLRGWLNIAIGLCMLLLGYRVVAFAISQFIIAMLFNVFYGWQANKLLGLYKNVKGNFNKVYVREIAQKGFGFLMTPMWQSILFQGTTFVIRLTLGPVAVTIFNTVRTLSRSVNQMYSLINVSIFPELQFEIGAGKWAKAQKIYIYAMRTTFILGLAGITFLAFFGLWLYGLWTHNMLTPPKTVWYMFLLGALFNAAWWTSGAVLRAMNRPYDLSVAGFITSVIAIICSYVFAQQWGFIGAAFGSLLFEILMMLYVLPVSCKLMHLSIKKVFDFKDFKIQLWKKQK